nr:hypothetical protein [Halomonas montanilacus]
MNAERLGQGETELLGKQAKYRHVMNSVAGQESEFARQAGVQHLHASAKGIIQAQAGSRTVPDQGGQCSLDVNQTMSGLLRPLLQTFIPMTIFVVDHSIVQAAQQGIIVIDDVSYVFAERMATIVAKVVPVLLRRERINEFLQL